MKFKKIIGPPGTGKTTYLMSVVKEALEKGIAPEDICFTTFSKAGVLEAKARARKEFGLTNDQLRNFTTIHSLCFRALNCSKEKVFSGKILGAFAKQLGLTLTWDDGEGIYTETKDDRIMAIINYTEVTKQDLKAVWEQHKDLVPWFELLRVWEAMKDFKLKNKLVSYNDMIIKCAEDPTIQLPKFKYLLVDEAQDSSTIQWEVIKTKLLDNAEVVYFAGDDDQSIFTWAGADVNAFIDFEAETTILGQSYRCPKLIQGLANRVTKHISKRIDKSWKPIEENGHIEVIEALQNLDLSKGNWLLLGRNKTILKKMETELKQMGWYYETKDSTPGQRAWKPSIDMSLVEVVRKYFYFKEFRMIEKKELLALLEYTKARETIPKYKKTLPEIITNENLPAELKRYFDSYNWYMGLVHIPNYIKYYISTMIKRGEKIFETPRIRVSTIHSIKGGQCENVVLCLDLSRSSFKALQSSESRDQELRVLYVGLTRSSKNLFLLSPTTEMNYVNYLKKEG